LGGEWKARWVDDQPLPSDIPIQWAYSVVICDDKGYVCRKKGTTLWDTTEGEPNDGEKAETFLQRIAKERVSASSGKIELVGFLDCKATSHNTKTKVGGRTTIPFFLTASGKVQNAPRDSEYERRRLPLNEFMKVLRARYPQFEEYMGLIVDRYQIMKAKGEIN
jgi:hypothetical protein